MTMRYVNFIVYVLCHLHDKPRQSPSSTSSMYRSHYKVHTRLLVGDNNAMRFIEVWQPKAGLHIVQYKHNSTHITHKKQIVQEMSHRLLIMC